MQIENAMYPVNVEALNTVFSPYGFVQKIAIFEKNGQTQVRQCLYSIYRHACAGANNTNQESQPDPCSLHHVWPLCSPLCCVLRTGVSKLM